MLNLEQLEPRDSPSAVVLSLDGALTVRGAEWLASDARTVDPFTPRVIYVSLPTDH